MRTRSRWTALARIWDHLMGETTIPKRPRLPLLRLETLESREVPASISGTVCTNLNGNGVYDGGDLGVSGDQVILHTPILFAVLATTTSGPNGTYTFDGVADGASYILELRDATGTTALYFGATTIPTGSSGVTGVDLPDWRPGVTVAKIADATEGGSNGTFRFTRTYNASMPLTVNYSVGGTATNGTDYTTLSGTVTIAAGQYTADVTIAPIDDGTSEPTETAILTVATGTGYAVGSSPATMNIFDNDAQYVSVEAVNDAVEGGTNGQFRFTRIGNLSSSLTANYSVSTTGTSGMDFTALSGTVSFAANSATADVYVEALDDVGYDPGETVSVIVTNGTGYSVGSVSTASLTITDDEMAPNYWIGGSGGNWSDGSNWTNGVPTSNTAVYFDGTHSNASVTIPDGGLGAAQFGELHLVGGYSGTVTLSNNVTVRNLELTSGTLDQPTTSYGSDLTVTVGLLWTGGTLNDTTNDATVNISGIGKIAPFSDGTIVTGSTLNFIGTTAAPTETTVEPGTVQFNNAAAAVIGFASTLKVEVLVSRPGTITGFMEANAKIIKINNGGSFIVRGSGNFSTNLPVRNAAGLFKLDGQVTATLSGGDAEFADYGQETSANAKLHIVSGSTLIAPHGVRIDGGSVFLIMNPNLPAASQTATITGQFKVTGGDIVFDAPIVIGSVLTYGTFTVNGDVNWSGGRYLPSIDGTNVGLANKWIISGTMTSAAACQVVANPLNGAPPANSVWTVLDAVATAGGDPTTPAGSPVLGLFTVGTRKVWKLTT